MIHLKQTRKSNCGQTAVAMLAEKSIEEIEALVGHHHSTTTRELVSVLRKLGYECDDGCRFKPIAFGLAQVHKKGRSGWHWVVVDGLGAWDGAEASPLWLEDYKANLRLEGKRITSYLMVERKNVCVRKALEAAKLG